MQVIAAIDIYGSSYKDLYIGIECAITVNSQTIHRLDKLNI